MRHLVVSLAIVMSLLNANESFALSKSQVDQIKVLMMMYPSLVKICNGDPEETGKPISNEEKQFACKTIEQMKSAFRLEGICIRNDGQNYYLQENCW